MIREILEEHEVHHETVVVTPHEFGLGGKASARFRWTRSQTNGDQIREALQRVKLRQLAGGPVVTGPVRYRDIARQFRLNSWQRDRTLPYARLADVRNDFVPADRSMSIADDDVEFRALVDEWREETAALPTVQQRAMHPAYQRIIGMGPVAIPMILRELQERGGHWYWALRFIAGADPVPDADRGRIAAMREHWLEWGRSTGHLAQA